MTILSMIVVNCNGRKDKKEATATRPDVPVEQQAKAVGEKVEEKVGVKVAEAREEADEALEKQLAELNEITDALEKEVEKMDDNVQTETGESLAKVKALQK